MLVLKKCPECGLYNDISVMQCSCGTNLVIVPAEAVPEPPANQRGQIDPQVPAYVQKCPFCQTENFTPAIDRPFRKCVSCNKFQISRVAPVLWSETPPEEESPKETPAQPVQTPEKETPPQETTAPITTNWATALAGITALTQGTQGTPVAETKPVPEVKKAAENLKLTAVGQYTGFSETFKKTDSPILLGRYACDALDRGDARMELYTRCERFFARDSGISGYHCHLVYKDDAWFIVDGSFQTDTIRKKASTNGTRVNETPITERQLRDGDVIKLGCRPDSVTLSVAFEA